jgi:exodeoxyribonuclease III
MKIATWNVNGIRARESQFLEFVERDRPDVICLQEIKARLDQVPPAVCNLAGYWCYWHGAGGYSGVGLHISREFSPEEPKFTHPHFDHETRIVQAEIGDMVFASVYVPNGGKDYAAKIAFLEELAGYAAALRDVGKKLVLCGDINIARTDMDVHPKERKPVIGQSPEERALLENIIAQGLVDVGRKLDPENENLFTWWAPWRNLRQRNIGWRLDYVLAAESLAAKAVSHTVQREFGTSDHGAVIVEFA